MLCEPALQPNNDFNPWTKRKRIKKNKRSGAPSSAAVSSKTSSQQYSSGTKFRTGKLLFKTSGSPEAKSITPEKDNDVEMDEVNEGGAAVAAGGSENAAMKSAGGGDKNSSGDEDVEMGEAGDGLDSSDDDAKPSKSSGEKGKNSASDKKMEGGSKNNGNGESKKSADPSKKDSGRSTTKKDNSGGNDENELNDEDAACPLLVGTLAYSDRDNLRRHIIRGNWKYENSPPQRFELIRIIPPEENLKELPKDGEFNGEFNVQHTVKTSKGKIKTKNRAVQESGVKLRFTLREDDEDEEDGTIFRVNGKGTNEYGVFELFGTATKNAGDNDPTYSVSVRKKYIPVAPVVPAKKSEGTKKDKKRKHAAAAATTDEDEEEKPPPTELSTQGVCLQGKLVRNTSDELSLDNAAVHRITGIWALGGLTKICEEPETCEKFEYEHKCSGDSSVFPLSGRYTGFFYTSEPPGQRTKIAERDVVLKFRRNNAGYYNVEGKGGNIYGKYTITGSLKKDGTITLLRHFQAPKAKGRKGSTQVKTSVPANGSSGGSGKSLPKTPVAPAAGQQGASSLLSFDDVNTPNGNGPVQPLSPPDQFTAISRGILKIESDGTHTCSGSWAMTNDHYTSGLTSKYHFGIMAENAVDDAKVMLERMKSNGLDEDDDRQIKNMASDGVSPVTLAHSTFPIDSTQYKGNFKLRKGASRTQTIVDQQIVLKYVKNSGGSYNVYGKGVNEMGTFDLVGTLILQGKSKGLMQLYRMYPPQEPAPASRPSSKTSAKVFRGSLTEKAADSGPVPAMKPPEPFVASTSGLLRERRESARMSRLPSRLEEDDPQAHMDRLMEKCRQILKELQESDVQQIFAAPVDPIALGIPTYFEVIKNPMDLGTIQTKMDHNEIDSPEEFARLVRLTFQNAITFNSMPDNIVNVTARNLLVVFNKRFGTIDKAFKDAREKNLTKAERQELKRKEKEAAKEAKRKAKEEEKRKRKAEVEATNESKRMKLENVVAANKSTMAAIAQAAPKDSDANMTRAEFNLLVQAIKQVQDQIVGLHQLIKKSSSNAASAAASSSVVGKKVKSDETTSAHAPPSVASESKQSSQPPKKHKKKPKKEPEPSPPPSPKPAASPEPPVVEELSYEEKEALSDAINLLPDRLLPAAMQIIREADLIDDDDEEIDLDIDQLDTKTQRKLQSFVMENVKQKKKPKPKKPSKNTKPAKSAPASPTPAPAPTAAPSPSPPPPEEEEEEEEEDTKPAATSAPPQGGKSLLGGNLFGDDLDDDDSDDDDKEDDEEEMQFDFTNLGANPSTQDAAEEEKEGGDDSDKDHGDDLWEESRKKAEADKALAADRAKREEKMLAEKEKAEKKRMAEAQALGEQAKARREEEEAAEARRLEEQEREAEEARKAAREKALQQINSVQTTIDTGDAQRDLMKQYEEEFNDNYSAGASPSSDFGF